MTVEKEDTDMLLTMVKAGLSDSHSKTQEAALMVIEQWRTRNCLIAIETAPSLTLLGFVTMQNKLNQN